MKVSIWHHASDKQPDKSGYYLAYRGWGMGGKADGDSDHGYLYYRKEDDTWYGHKGAWRSSFPDIVSFVYYWSDADPAQWVADDPPLSQRKQVKPEMHVAEREAWKNVQEALDRYNMIRTLLQ
jgi:hypothetical protein